MPDALPLTGLFGKVPAHGDFVRRGLPTSFVGPWDAWLQDGMATARDRLGTRWADAWDGAPPWRFALPAGACGPDAVAGVMLPSQDMVGRRFPITLAVLLAPGAPLPAPAWFAALEGSAQAGRDGRLDADALAAAIPLPGTEPPAAAPVAWPLVEPVDPPSLPMDSDQGVGGPAADLLGLFSAAAPAIPSDWREPGAPDVGDILGGASGLSMATPPAPEHAPADGTLAFLLGEAAVPAPTPDVPPLPLSEPAVGSTDGADPLAALIAAGAGSLAPAEPSLAMPEAAPGLAEVLPAEFDLQPVLAEPASLPLAAEPPPAPSGGGWWTGGGGRLPPAILPLPALLPVAEFASLLEADA